MNFFHFFTLSMLLQIFLIFSKKLTIENAKSVYENNNFEEAEDIFRSNLDSERGKYEFYKFLVETAQFSKIVDERKTLSLTSANYNEAVKIQSILKLKNHKEISKFYKTSFNSFDVIYSTILNALQTKKRELVNAFLPKLKRLASSWKSQEESKIAIYKDLVGRILLMDSKFDLAFDAFQDQRIKNNLKEFFDTYKTMENTFDNYKNMYVYSMRLMSQDSFSPNLYNPLVIFSLEKLVDFCLAHNVKGSSAFALRLVTLKDDLHNIQKHIRCCINDNKFEEATKILEDNRDRLSRGDYNVLMQMVENRKKFVDEEKKREEEKLRREQQRQKAEEEKRYSQMARNNKTNKAGTDFKGYYKTLGVDKTAGPKDVKKAWKKAARKAQRNINLKKKNLKEGETLDESELVQVNKANEILSDKKMKELYDNGIDPTDTTSVPNNQYQQFRTHDFMDEDILKHFFGGGWGQNRSSRQNGGRSSQRRTYYYYSY